MRKRITSLALGLVGAGVVLHGLAASAPAGRPAPAPRREVVKASGRPASASPGAAAAANATARFGSHLYIRLSQDPGNVFFSPLGIELALAMANEGAAGETARQIEAVLHLPDGGTADFKTLTAQMRAPDTAYDLEIANALWGQEKWPFRTAFLRRVETRFGAAVRRVDFADPSAVAAAVNGWTERQTHGHIKDLVGAGALRKTDRLILTNAVYFKGRWVDAFEPSRTSEQEFKPLSGPATRVPFMHRTGPYRYSEDEQAQVLELPYVGGRMSMLLILPKRAAELKEVERELTASRLGNWVSRMGSSATVQVHLPRFKVETQYELNRILSAMTMTDAFDPKRADFSGMDGRRDLHIGLVAHKAFVEVNEQGTTATAATAIVVGITSAPPEPVVFKADHPFVFVIRDMRTGAVLFMGRLAKVAG